MNRLKALRVQKGLSQQQLGSFLNCSDVTVSRYESEKHDMDSSTIRRVCDYFDCSADYLLGRSPLPTADLSEEEAALLVAWRRSDDRARDMVRLALDPFREESAGETAI